MLSNVQRQQFDRLGIMRLPQAIALPDVTAMCDQVWEFLSGTYEIKRDDPTSWTVGKPWHFQTLSRAGVFNAMGSSPVTTALDGLLGAENWRRPKVWGRPLVTFPAVDAA